MKKASITEAKNGLSALIDRVRHGQTVVIEDRGIPVARLEPVNAPGRDQAEGRAARLIRQGVLRPAQAALPRRLLATEPPGPARGAKASDVLIAERQSGR